ncbi:MAG: DUF362 domain-containing protein [Bacteroidales bacterium]
MKKIRFSARAVFFLTGIASTVWFLVRVIPKPSRAAYPCMRAAAPVMSGFILYLIGAGTAGMGLKKARQHIVSGRFFPAVLFAFMALSGLVLLMASDTTPVSGNVTTIQAPPDGPNNPMGDATGIMPGRVVWVWNPKAVKENAVNSDTQLFWTSSNFRQDTVDSMLKQALLLITGKTSETEAWDTLFRYHNYKRYDENRSYEPGDIIFIKINQTTGSWNITESGDYIEKTGNEYSGACQTSPPVVLALLRQLVNTFGVQQQDIYIGDPIAHIFKHNYDIWHSEFPNVHYVDRSGEFASRTQIFPYQDEPAIYYSDHRQIMPDAGSDEIYDKMFEARYLFNVTNLKGHVRAGITLGAKNHFGSQTRSGAGHLHPSLVSPDDENKPTNSGYKKYRVFVDIMGAKHLGGNTVLTIIDALFGGSEHELHRPVKWAMAPFNNNYCNSIFLGQDQVALESVCYDFLRTEFSALNPGWNGVDDYLHQAASSANWPTGIVYDPDNTGSPIPSLGVHEHWNNATNKQYSRNLKTGNGIELATWPENLVITVGIHDNKASFSQIRIYPNPAHDIAYLQVHSERNAEMEVQIVQLNGKMIRKSAGYIISSGELTIPLTLQYLEPGMYLCRVLVKNTAKTDVFTERIQVVK